MCSSGTNAHFDSILDEKLISKAISEFKEATEALDKKLKAIQTSAEKVMSNLAKGDDNLESLKSDVTENIKCIENILKKVEEEPFFLQTRDACSIDNWLQQAELKDLLRKATMEMPRELDFVIPSHAEHLQEVSKVQLKLRESANKVLDSAVDWIEKVKGEAERTVKRKNEIKDDLRKQFASLQELANQVQQVAVKMS